jgi:hypothetical protein
MWHSAIQSAKLERVTVQEAAWRDHVLERIQPYARQYKDYLRTRRPPGSLEWAKKITADDIGILKGIRPYNREAPEEDVRNLKHLVGHVVEGQFITKIRKVFHKDEMVDDLKFARAAVDGKDDDIEYYSILPSSPP